ncbi:MULTISPECIES: hypothetical protein [Mycolicibacterium]|uniref:Uncharacterized protein n=1 Tax=Mycolicibacterium wolinskyi TaxID=59750 RepID=A0A132PFJ2_9MYCO|nr:MULTISPECIES: hypothetical protein [Mycolicibacterium]KWX20977.1 hypothetical protein AFM11_27720 [Mycolicibacterium wolinskyi]MCV7290257.1 hypothetical protein [Mycolicibacterium wolinskyi]MCV7297630.1 hypothetical protein [Mycolicibacterium goodii]ORX09048.1 hypothetical protein AWC31_10255 [Mycolicibacterium wolinskyi]
MYLTKAALATVAAAGAIAVTAIGLGSATASADPVPPPGAPKKPAESWQGHPMVWAQLPAGGHWGVWVNGDFLPFT